jgi:hypothetical protein
MCASQRRAEILQYAPTFQQAWTGNGPHTTHFPGTITWKRGHIACASWPDIGEGLTDCRSLFYDNRPTTLELFEQDAQLDHGRRRRTLKKRKKGEHTNDHLPRQARR